MSGHSILNEGIKSLSNTVVPPSLQIRICIRFVECDFEPVFERLFVRRPRSCANTSHGSADWATIIVIRQSPEASNLSGSWWFWIALSIVAICVNMTRLVSRSMDLNAASSGVPGINRCKIQPCEDLPAALPQPKTEGTTSIPTRLRAADMRLMMATSFSTRLSLFMPVASGFVRRMMNEVVPSGMGAQPAGLGVSSNVVGEKVILYTKLLYLNGHSGSYSTGEISAFYRKKSLCQYQASKPGGEPYFYLVLLREKADYKVNSLLEIDMVAIHLALSIGLSNEDKPTIILKSGYGSNVDARHTACWCPAKPCLRQVSDSEGIWVPTKGISAAAPVLLQKALPH